MSAIQFIEAKIVRSGLERYFQHVEVVNQKNRTTYTRLLQRYAIRAEGFMMVGNSLRSDILPVLELGGRAVYIPYANTWAHEAAEPPPAGYPGYYQLSHVGLLPGLLEQIEGEAAGQGG
jgi:putative hydrolase of the HAD superfamily